MTVISVIFAILHWIRIIQHFPTFLVTPSVCVLPACPIQSGQPLSLPDVGCPRTYSSTWACWRLRVLCSGTLFKAQSHLSPPLKRSLCLQLQAGKELVETQLSEEGVSLCSARLCQRCEIKPCKFGAVIAPRCEIKHNVPTFVLGWKRHSPVYLELPGFVCSSQNLFLPFTRLYFCCIQTTRLYVIQEGNFSVGKGGMFSVAYN